MLRKRRYTKKKHGNEFKMGEEANKKKTTKTIFQVEKDINMEAILTHQRKKDL